MSQEGKQMDPDDGRLSRLYEDREPPGGMEERVVANLREANLLEPDSVSRGGPTGPPPGTSPDRQDGSGRMLRRLAASIVLVGLGWAAGSSGIGRPGESPSSAREATESDGAQGAQASSHDMAPAGAESPRFILLLYEQDDFEAADVDAQDDVVDEYRNWAVSLASAGNFVQGERLASNGSLVVPDAVDPQGAGSLLGDAILGGYFIVGAPSLAEAVRLAEGHPHRSYGGWIEVREIAPS